MPHGEHPAVEQLEEQLARISERLTRRQQRPGGWLGLLGGLGLGALTGGVLAYLLRSRQAEPPYIPSVPSTAAPRRADDAVVLRGTPAPASAPVDLDDDEPILLKTPTPPAAATEATDTGGQVEPSPVAAAEPTVENEAIPVSALTTDEYEQVPVPAEPTVENEAIPAPAETTEESVVAPAPVEPTVENEALPAAAIAEAPAEPVAAPSEADEAPAATEPEEATAPTSAEGTYPGSAAPIGDQCPPGYAIKGNRSRNGDLLYHTPTSNNFARTKPEACFATEADAEAAGFRKARS